MADAITPIFINGRFLGKSVTGIQRFAHEMVAALDAQLAAKDSALDSAKDSALRPIILAPRGTPRPENLSRIGFAETGSLRGHAWEQWDLWRAARGGFLLNLCNSGPVLHPRQMVVIHDAAVYRMPENYSRAYGLFHRALGRVLARRARLATVSDFSRRELMDVLGPRVAGMPVFPNGYDHILRIVADAAILDRLGLRHRPFFLFVGSPAPNKNLARAVEAFARLNRPDVSFVIVGAAQAAVFNAANMAKPENVIMTGRLTDGEIVALYRHATALVFPSLYEGFGIPPLEAMALGCPVVASGIAPVRETCGDAARYFNPHDAGDIARAMRDALSGPRENPAAQDAVRERLALYSWPSSAGKLLDWLEKSTGGMR
ncbi:MAG: glycosyltransferase family 4 protein [Alphaproteobacteria bacterium]|nr:glycosyltransferase family 4 protein [Alphaproteobacteria bacterium]